MFPNNLSKSEVESRTQSSRFRPRTQKKSDAKAKGSPSEDRSSQGQGQECWRLKPRTKNTTRNDLQTKRSSLSNFVNFPEISSVFQEKMSSKIFSEALWHSSRQKEIGHDLSPLEPRTGDFLGLAGFEAPAKNLTFEAKAMDFNLCLPGQTRLPGLHLW